MAGSNIAKKASEASDYLRQTPNKIAAQAVEVSSHAKDFVINAAIKLYADGEPLFKLELILNVCLYKVF